MKRLLGASALVLLSQCAPECAPDPTGSDGPQFEQELNAQAVEPGNCESYWPLMQSYGLPRTFVRIAWRESGCDHRSFVIDRDDAGGGLLGLNLKGVSLARGWYRWCGLTLGNVTDAETNVRCAAVAYQKMGMAPWR
jgi:hypothetical protein